MARDDDGDARALRTDEVVVVYKRSDLQVYVEDKKNPLYVELFERKDPVVAPLVLADRAHRAALERVVEQIERAGVRVKQTYRARFRAEEADRRLIVTVGGDGTLLDAAKRVREGALLGVNSDPDRSVGFLCAATADDAWPLIARVLEGAERPTRVARLSLTVDGERHKTPVLNDVLFAHKNPAATTRYRLSTSTSPKGGAKSEVHRSSGVWVAAPSGTTAGILSAGGHVQALDDGGMQYRVREPFTLGAERPTLTGARLTGDARLTLVSLVREGVVYVDGPHEKIPLTVGATLVVANDAPPLPLVVTEAMRARRAALG